jgi:hypothetical protein
VFTKSLKLSISPPGSQFTCVASAKVQILTPEALRARDEAERKTQMLERANRDLDVANETVRQLSDQQHRYLIQSNPI